MSTDQTDQTTPTPLWFHFDQNNSGGNFKIDHTAGIGENVWIEAFTPEQANARAEKIGIYFDGCADGRDCGCCGDRWSKQSGLYDAAPTILHYDTPMARHDQHIKFGWFNTAAYAHPLTGPFYIVVPASALPSVEIKA